MASLPLHLQMLSRPISSSFAATSGQGYVGVPPGHPVPRVWECVFCLLPCAPLPAGPLQQKLLISLSRTVVKCVLPSGC